MFAIRMRDSAFKRVLKTLDGNIPFGNQGETKHGLSNRKSARPGAIGSTGDQHDPLFVSGCSANGKQAEAEWDVRLSEYSKAFPDLAKESHQGMAGELPKGWDTDIPIVAARQKLIKSEINVRIVSMPSWELFDAQPPSYRDSVLPPSLRARLAVEAGAERGQW